MSPRELEGDVAECPKCQWFHRPSQPCPKSKPRVLQPPPPSSADVLARFSTLGAAAAEAIAKGENKPVATGRLCPSCGTPILRFRNFLGHEWEGISLPDGDHEDTAEHQRRHQGESQPATLPTLQAPRRAGLPYRKDIDE